ncbi:hypothetical protein M8494_15705 [Serratia ureilytica]
MAILFMFVWTYHHPCARTVYRKQRPALHQKSIYKMPAGKPMCWVCMAFFVFVFLLLSLREDTRQALIVTRCGSSCSACLTCSCARRNGVIKRGGYLRPF